MQTNDIIETDTDICGKIYKIEPINGEDGDIYIGSTCEKYISYRYASHVLQYKHWKCHGKNFVSSYNLFDKYGVDNCKIVLLEDIIIRNKTELLIRETELIRSIKCINIKGKYPINQKIVNLYYEVNFDCQEVKEETTNNIELYFMKVKSVYIRNINKKLGLTNSSLSNIIISRNKIEELEEYLFSEEKSIRKLFNIKDKCKDNGTKYGVRRIIEFINKIYFYWSGIKIISKSNISRGKVPEFVTYMSPPSIEKQ